LLRRRLGLRLPILAGLAGAGLCAAVLAVGLRLSAPARTAVGPAPADLAGAEAVAFSSPSGALLRGWWVPGAAGGGSVVLLHGAWEDRRRMLPRARVLHAEGFAVLLPDLQAHGESTGRRITFGRREGQDAAAALRFVRERVPGERVGVLGVSLGGAAALLGPKPLAADAMVLESVYPSIEAALGNRLRARLGALAARPLAPVFALLLPPVLGVRPEELRPIDRIGAIRAPLLLASGTHDDRTTIAEARALFDRAPAPRQFWAVEGAAHEDLEGFAPEPYWSRVLPFLVQHLRR
jgi:alpha-beta hydrolase superfamily lysophospholipase